MALAYEVWDATSTDAKPCGPFDMTFQYYRVGLLLLVSAFWGHALYGQSLTMNLPKPRQIVQRTPSQSADIFITGNWMGTAARLEARAVVMPGSTNNGVSTDWVVLVDGPTDGAFSGTLHQVAAGGWYRIEVRAVDAATNVLLLVGVDRVGVGDILLTAGQSNAACFGTPQQVPTDDRVSAYIVSTKSWQFARDGQPDNSGGMGSFGSPWPILGSLLVASNQVPIGFVGLAYGGTAVSQWLPGTALYANLTNALRIFGTNGIRAALWHQGEADSGNQTAAVSYALMLSNVITQSRLAAGWSLPWGIAEVGANPSALMTAREAVAAGQRQCTYTVPNCFRGARTDDYFQEGKLSGDNIHFNGAGLADHAQQWANALLGVEALAVKDGKFESNIALLDGRTEITTQMVGWNRINAAGDAGVGGNGGYLNPNSTYYLNSADTISGGVLTNMNGRHIATLYSTTSFFPPGDAFLQTIRAHLQPSTIYTMQVAMGVRNSGQHGGYRLDFLTNGIPIGAGVTGNLATLNALAGGDAANKFTVVSCVVTSAVAVTSNQQLAIRISKPGPGGTYLDFDDVRLTAQLTPYGEWQLTNWASLFNPNSLPEADPDGDGLPNLVEFQLAGCNPLAPNPMPQPTIISLGGEDYLNLQLWKNASAGGGIEIQVSFDLINWFTPVSSGNGDMIVVNDSTQFTVQVRRSAAARAFFRIAARP